MSSENLAMLKTRSPAARPMRVPCAVALVAALFLTVLVAPVSAETRSAEYNMPSSAVVRGIFGIGKLLCADDNMPELLVETAKNGPCFDYSGREGDVFVLSAQDALWADTSVTAAIDLNGDGCVSDSCQGQPNDADYRVSNCGAVAGILPFTNGGDPIIQVFLRVIDVTPDLRVCGATTGVVNLDIA